MVIQYRSEWGSMHPRADPQTKLDLRPHQMPNLLFEAVDYSPEARLSGCSPPAGHCGRRGRSLSAVSRDERRVFVARRTPFGQPQLALRADSSTADNCAVTATTI